jgi:translation initiation factor IF-2
MADHDSSNASSPKEVAPLSLSTSGLKKNKIKTQVVQSFSHGRSKAVTVEVKRKRVMQGETSASEPALKSSRLTVEEQDTRIKAAKDALQTAVREAALAEKLAQTQALLEQELAEEMARQALEAEKNSPKTEASCAPEITPLVDSAPVFPSPEQSEGTGKEWRKKDPITSRSPRSSEATEEEDFGKERKKVTPLKSEVKRSGLTHKEAATKNHLIRLYSASDSEESAALDTGRRRSSSNSRSKKKQKGSLAPPAPKVFRDVTIPPTITVQELASRMSEKSVDVIKVLLKMGVMVTVTQTLDGDTAELVATEMGHRPIRVFDDSIEGILQQKEDRPEDLLPRPPVVTVMGHVDHGKTSLLDALRKTNVVSGEAGGITQHIGAYQIVLPSGKITFIDTPGHAAFTEMRARGAHITDLVVLVVAADDGVKEQTAEAIRHAHAAQVPLIVAINKMDKHDANPDVVRQMLLNHEIVVESLGGDVQDVPLSAKTGMNLDKLEDAILLQAEILNLKANPHKKAHGTIIEARLERGRGPVATVLVQGGTLKVGDIFVSGNTWGRVRALLNDQGTKIEEALPSQPVEILGFSAPPAAGDDFVVLEEEAAARNISEMRERKQREAATAIHKPALTLENFMAFQAREGKLKELPLVLKVDVQGSLEAIQTSLQKIATDEVKVRIIYSGVGGITESDMNLAKASNALIIGFNVRANTQAREISQRDNIEIRYYSIIYNLIDEVKAALSGLLTPVFKEVFLGNAAIRQVFNITKAGRIAGCYVTIGMVKRGARVRLLRDHVVIHEGTLKTLKRLKDEVKEVKEGYECGMAFENYQDIREGDVVECFEIESIQRTL